MRTHSKKINIFTYLVCITLLFGSVTCLAKSVDSPVVIRKKKSTFKKKKQIRTQIQRRLLNQAIKAHHKP
jgi:hypothetical protein